MIVAGAFAVHYELLSAIYGCIAFEIFCSGEWQTLHTQFFVDCHEPVSLQILAHARLWVLFVYTACSRVTV